MIFAILAVAASAASLAFAQDVSFTDTSLTQCQSSTFNFGGSGGPYYVAVVPAADACTSDPLAEYHDITGPSVDYTVNIPEGTQVQVYVADNYGNEYWSAIMTVGAGDSSCLDGSSPSVSVESVETETTTSSSTSTTSSSTSTTQSAYVVPVNAATTTPRASYTNTVASNSNSDGSDDDTPANAATNGASTTTVSFTLIGGALFAAAALF